MRGRCRTTPTSTSRASPRRCANGATRSSCLRRPPGRPSFSPVAALSRAASSTVSSPSRAPFPSRRARQSGSRWGSARTSPRRCAAAPSTSCTGSTRPFPGSRTSPCSRRRRRRPPRSSIRSASASRPAGTSATGCSPGSTGCSRRATRSPRRRRLASRARTPSSRRASTSSASRRARRRRSS